MLLGAPSNQGGRDEYGNFTDAAALFRWCLTALELTTVKSAETPICEEPVKYAAGRSKVTLVPEKDLITILPKNLGPDNIVIETEFPKELEAPLKTDQVVGTASVYYIDPETSEKQLIESVGLLPAEEVEHSGFMATLEIGAAIFKSYWFLFAIGLIVLVVVIYLIASKIHRNRQKKNRDVKRYRNL